MSELFILKNSSLQHKLANSFALLSHKIARCYAQLGESDQCIHAIKSKIAIFCEQQINELALKPELVKETDGIAQNTHGICRVVNSQHLKVSLHIAPYNTALPRHGHLDTIAILLPIAGNLMVTQYHANNSKRVTMQLQENQCAIGLKRHYNQHSFRVSTPYCIFFSIRYKSTQSLPALIHTKLITVLSVILFPAYIAADTHQVMSHSDCVESELAALANQEEIAANDIETIIKQADQIRKSSQDDEILYHAAKLYHEAAKKNHPEAQYWFGYMLLRGLGITEDSDQALYWIAASSDQKYPPAQKLLEYILTHDPALDC